MRYRCYVPSEEIKGTQIYFLFGFGWSKTILASIQRSIGKGETQGKEKRKKEKKREFPLYSQLFMHI